MPKHLLHIPGFIDPRWYRSHLGRKFTSVVNSNGNVVLDGQVLSGCQYQAGTSVEVFVGSQITCLSASELAEQRAIQTQNLIKESLDSFGRERLRARQTEDEMRNLELPVQWTAARLDNLSGLTESSSGNGYKANTVHHVLLQEPLKAGRLERVAGEYLCRADRNAKGNYSGTSHSAVEFFFDYKELPARISCKQCLKLAASVNRQLTSSSDLN